MWRAHGWTLERERQGDGSSALDLTVFLAGAECPFDCVFCDLWRHTTPEPTPPGAIPEQLRRALGEAAHDLAAATAPAQLKLYNASNFFERRAVPPADDGPIAELSAPFSRVIVECHPRLVGRRCREFAGRLAGRLEVAMGLETIHPEALPRLRKGLTLDDYARAAGDLADGDIDLRAFVLLGAPYVPPAESVEWALRSAEHAVALGARHVTLIPVRGGGELDALAASGDFTPPTLVEIERSQEEALAAETSGSVITVDTWDLARFSPCEACAGPRRRRLERINLSAVAEPRVQCAACDGR